MRPFAETIYPGEMEASRRRFGLATVLFLLAAPAALASDTTIQYLGHAAFQIRSPRGATVVIDPYSSDRAPGLLFPISTVAPDVVLSSNPLPAHDGTAAFGETPILRRPGVWELLDLRVEGVEGRHGDPAASRDFGGVNTIWTIEAGGTRLVHLGANGPVDETALRIIGGADILIAPIDDRETLLSFDQTEDLRRKLGARIVIPMRYREEKLFKIPTDFGPIERFLAETRSRVRRLSQRSVTLPPDGLPADPEVWALTPVDPGRWSGRLVRAWELTRQARSLIASDAPAAVELLEMAFTYHDGLPVAVELAHAYIAAGQENRAQELLEVSLIGDPRGSRGARVEAHLLLARIYDGQKRSGRAAEQYLYVVEHALRPDWLDEARRYLGPRAR